MSKLKKKGKKGDLNLSFGMIFSIILIIAFIAFAFFAIKKFLDFQDTINIEKFKSDLQSDVDSIWKSSQGSQEVEYNLPKKITAVCFKERDELEPENLYFESERIITGVEISHLDIDSTLSGEESACFENTDGKVKMILKKDFSDVLVTIAHSE